jgi:hypothetical protein
MARCLIKGGGNFTFVISQKRVELYLHSPIRLYSWPLNQQGQLYNIMEESGVIPPLPQYVFMVWCLIKKAH